MGPCGSVSHHKELSEALREKAVLIFQKIDVDKKGAINREET